MLHTIECFFTGERKNVFILSEDDETIKILSESYFYFLISKYITIEKFPSDLKTTVLLKPAYSIISECDIDLCKMNFVNRMDIDKLNNDPYFILELVDEFHYNKGTCMEKVTLLYNKYITIIDKFTLVYLLDYLTLSTTSDSEFENYLQMQEKNLS